MEIKAFIKEVSSVKGVTKVDLIRNNVVKCNLDKEVSKDFFVKLKDDFGFEHCSLITAIDNQPQFELVYHFSAINGSVFVKDSTAAEVVKTKLPQIFFCCELLRIFIVTLDLSLTQKVIQVKNFRPPDFFGMDP